MTNGETSGSDAAPAVAVEDEARPPDEVAATDWILERVAGGRRVPVAEAEAVVNTLFGVQKWSGRLPFPLLPVAELSAFQAIHAVNVASTAMTLAGSQQFDPPSVRRVGLAGLLHDIGMTRIPAEIWQKPGQLSPAEREQVKRHPAEGASLLLDAHESLDLAAVVAYEHHIRMDGSGYPALTYTRSAHFVSRLVQVCDVFCALGTDRPYRKAWPLDVILSFLAERSGFEFHPTLASTLSSLARESMTGTTV